MKKRTNNFYYVDKTGLIEQLFSNWGEVNLFTCPRRFGKTLNMSMLKCFLEIGCDKSLFNGLYISNHEEHTGKYPVFFLTLKGVDSLNFNDAKRRFVELIKEEARKFTF